MWKLFDDVRKTVHFEIKKIQIDNPVFKLHYKFTFCILLICTVLVSCQQYIGEHIRCISDNGVSPNVIETFCFFTTTFTVVRHLNGTDPNSGAMVAHPGVGPYIEGEPIIHHAYYQWVPFVLFGQALLFYMPHLIWKKMEGGRVKKFAGGFEYAQLAFSDKETKVDKGVTVPSKKERMEKIEKVRGSFTDHLVVNRHWAYGLILAELLNVLNLVLQIWLMNWFLGGQFLSIGSLIVGRDPEESMAHPMDIIFPKVTKCNFYKYGPTGTIQQHDALCVMALNIINEKIYVFLWFWFLILLIITLLALVYRIFTMILYKRSEAFNRYTFRYCCPVRLDPISLRTVTEECSYSDWVFLHYLAISMDGFVFHDFFDKLAEELEERKKKSYMTISQPEKSYLTISQPEKSSMTISQPESEPLKADKLEFETEKVLPEKVAMEPDQLQSEAEPLITEKQSTSS